MFHPTLPADATELMRVSEFEREQPGRAETGPGEFDAGATRLSALNPSLLQDLTRAAPGAGGTLDLLDALAAALRHRRALRLHLQLAYQVIPLTVRPAEGELDSPLPLPRWLDLPLPELRLLRVEPAPPRPAPAPTTAGPAVYAGPLAPLLWELALRGARGRLLREIDGVAAYRVAPGADLRAVDLAGLLSGTLADAVQALRRQARPLREIAAWPGFDRDRAVRLLNALYLQAALMISRAHPAALQ
ncbi:MAG: hypothetical protein KGJ24_10105 [Burkholderiales bacterium]|nr:hypothetical protein [Burkholderiales bacterium]